MSAINMDVDSLYEELAKIHALVTASANLIAKIADDNTGHASVLLSLANEHLVELQYRYIDSQAEGETA